jgi:Surface lipoprotein assembly modifier
VLTILIKQVMLAALIVSTGGFVCLSGRALANEQGQQKLGVEAMFAALNEGQFDIADAIAATLDSNAEDRSLFSTFARATRLVANNDCASGAPLAQNVVSRSPLFLPAYDLIAKCLVDAGEPDKAAAMFEDVASRLNKGAERDQILARAQSIRPDMSAKFSIDTNLQPSTNANRGTSATDINGWQISESSRTKAGVMASAFGTITKPVYLSKQLISSVSLRAGAYYDTVSAQMFPTARLSLNTRYLLSPQTSFGAVLTYEHTLKGGSFESASPSIALDVSHQVSAALSVGARAELAYTHHDNTQQTGWTAKLDTNISYTILPNDRLSAATCYVREDRNAATQSYHQIAVTTEWEHAFASGFIGSLGGEASYRVYRSNAPLTFDKQVNIQTKATIGISHRDLTIGKFRPELAYTFTKQWSNDVFSDFIAHDVSLRAKAAF